MTSSIVSIPISLQTTGPSEPGLSQREAPGVGAGHLQADPLFALVVTQVKGPQGEEVPQLLPARWGTSEVGSRASRCHRTWRPNEL